MELKEIQSSVDNYLVTQLDIIIGKQEDYLKTNSKYWQGLSFDTEVKDYSSIDSVARGDTISSKPTNETVGWTDILPEITPATCPATITIDIYDGPLGKGWLVKADFIYLDSIYRKIRNVGPELYRESDWQTTVIKDVINN